MEQHVHLGNVSQQVDGDFHLDLTAGAIEMARSLMHRRGLAAGALRVSVTGGGCSGLQYGIAVDEQQRPDDLVIERGDVRVFVDPESASYLNGVTIDYVNALHGAGFKFINPKANRTCGCGSSFSV